MMVTICVYSKPQHMLLVNLDRVMMEGKWFNLWSWITRHLKAAVTSLFLWFLRLWQLGIGKSQDYIIGHLGNEVLYNWLIFSDPYEWSILYEYYWPITVPLHLHPEGKNTSTRESSLALASCAPKRKPGREDHETSLESLYFAESWQQL